MGALLDQIAAQGVTIEAAGDGKVRARGPLTDELRATIREHKAVLLAELAANEPAIDPDVERRRNRALSILEDRPEQRIAVVAEPGDPARIVVAIREVAVGELEIAGERFDAFAVLALMSEHGHA